MHRNVFHPVYFSQSYSTHSSLWTNQMVSSIRPTFDEVARVHQYASDAEEVIKAQRFESRSTSHPTNGSVFWFNSLHDRMDGHHLTKLFLTRHAQQGYQMNYPRSIRDLWGSLPPSLDFDTFRRHVEIQLKKRVAGCFEILPAFNRSSADMHDLVKTVWYYRTVTTYADLHSFIHSLPTFKSLTSTQRTNIAFALFMSSTRECPIFQGHLTSVHRMEYMIILLNLNKYKGLFDPNQWGGHVPGGFSSLALNSVTPTASSLWLKEMLRKDAWVRSQVLRVEYGMYYRQLMESTDDFMNTFVRPLFVTLRETVTRTQGWSASVQQDLLKVLDHVYVQVKAAGANIVVLFCKLFSPESGTFESGAFFNRLLRPLLYVTLCVVLTNILLLNCANTNLAEICEWVGHVLHSCYTYFFGKDVALVSPTSQKDLSKLFAEFMLELLRQMKSTSTATFDWLEGYVSLLLQEAYTFLPKGFKDESFWNNQKTWADIFLSSLIALFGAAQENTCSPESSNPSEASGVGMEESLPESSRGAVSSRTTIRLAADAFILMTVNTLIKEAMRAAIKP